MNALLSKLAVIGVVAGGFYATGDLPRLIDRGRRIAERTSVPFPAPQQPAPAAQQPAVGSSAQAAPAPPAVPVIPAVPAEGSTPIPKAAPAPAVPPADHRADEPTRIPLPPLELEAVDLAALHPGQRVLMLCGRHVIALDVVDGPAGEVLEHSHAVHADRTVTIASTAAPRRLVTGGCSAGSGRLKPREDRRIVRGEWLHVSPSGGSSSGSITSGGATPTSETLGPIEAIGIE